MSAIQLYQPVTKLCPICREFHWAPSDAAFARKVDECRTKFIGFLNNREYINSLTMKPAPVDPNAETVVKPIQVAS